MLRRAKHDGVPKANIEGALARAGGERGAGSQLATYEAIAHGAVGIIVCVPFLLYAARVCLSAAC